MTARAEKTITGKQVLRIIDANLNRLREALRVIEEYYRFASADKRLAASLKRMRHSLEGVEAAFGAQALLASRDVASDPFANVNRPEELTRTSGMEVLRANFKRGQEAARVIEEFAKVSAAPALSEKAKAVRFSLYTLEKEFSE
jgi:thiamine-phosphate pyrophosphorylase